MSQPTVRAQDLPPPVRHEPAPPSVPSGQRGATPKTALPKAGSPTKAPSGPLLEPLTSPSSSSIAPQPETPSVRSTVKRLPATRTLVKRPTRGPQPLQLLASFSTPYNARIRGRTNNLRMAARLVNGTVVPPGATFSANQALGPRHTAAGWREAKMFVSGQVVSGVGAGICQCSTTIYNAALLAGLPIVERHPHSFRVDYAPPSRDAAIYWGGKDMRFRNNTAGPIIVQTWLRGGRFHARLLGTEPVLDRIQVVSRTLSRSGGTRSEAYRIVETETGTLRQRLSRDFYKRHP